MQEAKLDFLVHGGGRVHSRGEWMHTTPMMKQMLVDYGFNQGTLTLFCDNMSAINISKNLVQHSRTKHIDIRHHFIRELVENKCIVLEHVGANDQLADLFTKSLDVTRFKILSRSIWICLME